MKHCKTLLNIIVAGAIAGEINSIIYLRFVFSNRINVEAQRILSKNIYSIEQQLSSKHRGENFC